MRIPRRFNGPLHSGQGGYSAGTLAKLVDGPTEVTLRRPVPLETELVVEQEKDGSLRALAGHDLIMEADAAPELDIELPGRVAPDAARAAAQRYRGAREGIFSRCFVCGLAREDALGVFAGDVDGRQLVASPWTPPRWSADSSGDVLSEFVWSVLDCPTAFAAYVGEKLPMSVLARLAVRIMGRVRAGEEHVLMAWPLGVDGRKRHAGAALLSSGGEPLAVARALMIEPRDT